MLLLLVAGIGCLALCGFQVVRMRTVVERERSKALKTVHALAAAPWSEELKKGPFTAELLKQATRIGFSLRMKVNIVWMGTTLRLERSERDSDQTLHLLCASAPAEPQRFAPNGMRIRWWRLRVTSSRGWSSTAPRATRPAWHMT